MITLKDGIVAVLVSDNIWFRPTGAFLLRVQRKKFESMNPYKPDMIITNCPGCPMFLDKWQYAISEMEGIPTDRMDWEFRYLLLKKWPVWS